jgi:5-methylcytosine-specific restriction enzyme subunit McrC
MTSKNLNVKYLKPLLMTPVEALCAAGILKATAGPYQATIELAEHETREATIGVQPSSELSRISNLFSRAVEAGLVTLDFQVGRAGEITVLLSSESTVGIAICEHDGFSLFLKVEPKIGAAKLLDLVVASGNAPDWARKIQIDARDVSSIIEWKVRAFHRAVVNLVRQGGIRGNHLRKRSDLVGIVKGRLIVSDFIKSFARGRPEIMPCEFPSFEIDHEYNRLIKWCLRHARSALSEAGGNAKLEDAVSELETHFIHVELIAPSRKILQEGGRMPPNLRHYEEAIRLARFLLADLRFVANPGKMPAGTIAINMNQAYEAAFKNLSRSKIPQLFFKPVWKRPLYDLTTKQEAGHLRLLPDLYLDDADLIEGCSVILDTKWKSIYGSATIEDILRDDGNYIIKPRSSDIYQALFYGLHRTRTQKKGQNCLCVLLYPTLGAASELYDDFPGVGSRLRIVFLGWDLTGELDESVRQVWERIDALRLELAKDSPNSEQTLADT